MNIDPLFQKSIHRNINGVIKVAQQDDDSVRQELEEYIVTKELDICSWIEPDGIELSIWKSQKTSDYCRNLLTAQS